jgi:hypothetical protein
MMPSLRPKREFLLMRLLVDRPDFDPTSVVVTNIRGHHHSVPVSLSVFYFSTISGTTLVKTFGVVFFANLIAVAV